MAALYIHLDAPSTTVDSEMATNEFGRWLQHQLDRRGWKQADLARKMPATTGTISHWITGKRIPDPASCDLIADVLGIDIDVVLGVAGHRPNVQALDPDSVEAELSGLVHRIAWTEERAATVRMILRQYIELDRKR